MGGRENLEGSSGMRGVRLQGAVLATTTGSALGGKSRAAPVHKARDIAGSWKRQRCGKWKREGFSSLGRGREPGQIARRGWRRREGKHRLCKKRNGSYRRLVLSWLSSGPRVILEGRSTLHPLSEAKAFILYPGTHVSHGKCLVLPKFLKSQTKIICRKVLLRRWSF